MCDEQCCSEDVKEENNCLLDLEKFVPVHVVLYASVRMMKAESLGTATIHECAQSDYQTPLISVLVHHTKTQAAEKRHLCELCQKKFDRKSTLNRHVLVHQDIKRFQCDKCDYNTVTKQNLGKHYNLFHTGVRPFECDECDYSTIDRVSLGRHKMLHTGEKPFSCTQCNYKARQGVHLTRHMLSHSMPVQSVTTAQL